MKTATCACLAVMLLTSTAVAQVTLRLEAADDPQADSISLSIGESALVRLVLDIADDTQVVSLDAILNYLDADAQPGTGVQIIGFNDSPDLGNLALTTRGSASEASADAPAAVNDYQLVLDDSTEPLDADSGLTGPATIVVDEIILRGEAEASDTLFFAFGAQAPAGFQLEANPVTEELELVDLAIELGRGSAEDGLAITVTAPGGDNANGNDNSDGSADNDGDGLTNDEEAQIGTDPDNADSDGDQIDDGYEVQHGLDPTRDDAEEDPDGDGLDNFGESAAGTDPNVADTDGDGLNDFEDPQPLEAGSTNTGGGRRANTSSGLCGLGVLGPIALGLPLMQLLRGRRRVGRQRCLLDGTGVPAGR